MAIRPHQRLTALVCAWATVFASLPWPRTLADGEGSGALDHVRARWSAVVDASRPSCEALAQDFPVRVEELAATLGRDWRAALAFVAGKIAAEPYAGAMRGAEGALRARAAGATDRAALLGEVLEAMGAKRVRYVRRAATDASPITSRPRPSLDPERAAKAPAWIPEAEQGRVEARRREAGEIVPGLRSMVDRATAEAARIEAALPAQVGATWEAPPVEPDRWLVGATLDGRWRLLDPASGTAEEAAEHGEARLPDAEWHDLGVTLWVGSATAEADREVLLARTFRTADLADRTLYLQLLPNTPADAPLAWDKVTGILPVLRLDDRLFYGRALSLDGGVHDAAGWDPTVGFGKALEEGLGGLGRALGGGSDRKRPATGLEAMGLSIAVRSPGRPEHMVERLLYERRADEPPAEQALRLCGDVAIDASTYFPAPGALVRSLEDLAGRQTALVSQAIDGARALDPQAGARVLAAWAEDRVRHAALALAVQGTLMGTLGAELLAGRFGELARHYRHRPGIVLRHTRPLPPDGRRRRIAIDLAHNPVAVAGVAAERRAGAAIALGVLESLIEAFVLERFERGPLASALPRDEALALLPATAAGATLLAASGLALVGDAGAFDRTGAGETVRRAWRADLAGSVRFLIPADGNAGALWRVDPTGSSVRAVLPDGSGGTFVEYVLRQARLLQVRAVLFAMEHDIALFYTMAALCIGGTLVAVLADDMVVALVALGIGTIGCLGMELMAGIKGGRGSGGGDPPPRRGPTDGGRQVKGLFPERSNPNDVLYRRDPSTGKITHYEVYGADGLPIKRVDVTGQAHGGVPTPHVLEWERHVNPKTGQQFVKPGKTVRPATADELPE